MLWIYARGDESLRVETRFDMHTEEFVLTIYPHDSDAPKVERFGDSTAFGRRLAEVEHELTLAKWRLDGAPVVLRHGWKI